MNTSAQNPDELFDEQIKIWEENITSIQSAAIKKTNLSKTKVIDSLITRLPSNNICDAVMTKVDSEKTAMIKEEKEREKAANKITMMKDEGESTPLHLFSEADDTNEKNLCEKCKSHSGAPAYFHYGTQNSTEKASMFKKTTTTKSQSIGISSAIVCTECVARFRWTSLIKLFSQFLLIAVVLGVCMFIPVLNALAGVLLIFLPILFLILFVTKLFSSLRTLAEELAVNLREKEFEKKGFNKLWTSDEYRSTFRQISSVSNLWNPPTPFNPGNSLKQAAGVTLLSFTLFCLSITTYVFLIVITPIGTPDTTVWINENYRWYNIFSTLGCLTAPLPFLGGIIWFIGTYRSTKT